MKKMLAFARRYKCSLMVVAVIVYLSFFKPPSTSLGEITNFDKFVHACMYFGFCSVIWFEYLRSHTTLCPRRMALGGVVLPILFSGLVELGQKYLTLYRSGEWWDFASNTFGVFVALVGMLIVLAVRKKKARR